MTQWQGPQPAGPWQGQQWQGPPWPYRRTPSRPGSVTAAAIILIVVGSLVFLISLGAMLGGLAWESIQSDPNFREQFNRELQNDPEAAAIVGDLGGIFLIIGVVLALFSVAHIASGIGVLSRHGWARMVGLLLASIGALLALIGIGLGVLTIVSPEAMSACPAELTADECRAAAVGGGITNIVTFLILAGIYGFIAYALIRRGRWFDRTADEGAGQWAPAAGPGYYPAPVYYPPPGYQGPPAYQQPPGSQPDWRPAEPQAGGGSAYGTPAPHQTAGPPAAPSTVTAPPAPPSGPAVGLPQSDEDAAAGEGDGGADEGTSSPRG